jgi:hypothetical protein
MAYKATRLAATPATDGAWDGKPWPDIGSEAITHWMGKEPTHLPATEFKVAYDDNALYVIFQVQDQYVRAVADEYQGPACEDSCVEFFFTPNDDVASGYFNLEMNCSGTALFMFQKARGVETIRVPQSDFEQMTIAHSLSGIIDPEITEPTIWTIEYRLPLDILKKYCRVTQPEPGATWRVNFYKCGDNTSHPHWLTWSKVDSPTPDFHRPESFGRLQF